ncbi:MAG: SusC/RagA family TonB-linked outer membrane protein [Reichenbachiella sp.]|uniref:SusC/RagA family TonB-linked outer membrane protein n=1 Tax=Reichenbachiella sp. TaxID=2184521 RepID=UPI0032659AAF
MNQKIPPNIKVTGTVTNQKGEALASASVAIQGQNIGVITDLDGKYVIEVPEESVLSFSYLGYHTQVETVGARSVIDVQLIENISQLFEVIVTGYGTRRNEKVSSAIVQTNNQELQIDRRPVMDIQSALVGSMPGLIINQNSGKLGSDVNVMVRATSALSERGALILIDGFEGSMADVAPAAIATVTLLKDAAATSIYGARGANGVVLITTKSPKRDQPLSVTYSLNYALQRPAQTAQIVGSEEFMQSMNQATLNETLRNSPETLPESIQLPFSSADLDRASNGFYPENQWVDKLYNERARQIIHNIAITGGTEKTAYFININQMNQNGLLNGADNLKKSNLRLNIETDFTDWLTFGANLFVVERKLNNVPTIEDRSIRGRPFFPVQLPNGSYVQKGAADGIPNPIAMTNSGSYDRQTQDVANLQLYTQIKPLPWLVLEERLSYVRKNTSRDIWNNPYEYVILDLELNQVGETIPISPADRNLEIRSGRSYAINTLTTAQITKQINQNHNIQALVGIQTTIEEKREQRAGRSNFILENVQDLSLGREPLTLDVSDLDNIEGAVDPSGNTSRIWDNRTTLSYFGRISYDYNSRYLAEFSMRADASSNFSKSNRWGYFPAFSVGWNVDQEGFMSGLSLVDMLKVRASWGLSGDDGSVSVVERANFSPNGASLGGTVVPVISLGNAVNEDLKWETSKKMNLGVNLSLWRGKFSFALDYFIDKREDIITTRLTSLESGLATGILDNVYGAKSWGWEMELGHKNHLGPVEIFSNFNLSYYDSEITETDGLGPISTNASNYQDKGLPIFGNWYGYETNGFFNTQQDIDNHTNEQGVPLDQSAVSTGDDLGRYLGGYRYMDQITVDTDGDGIADARDGIINADDRVVLMRNAVDNYRFGFDLGASYKRFSFSVRLFGVLKSYEWWNSGRHLNQFTGDLAPFVFQTDTWTPDNTNATFPQSSASNIIPFEQDVSDLIQKNAYIKVKNINLTYSFGPEALNKSKVIKDLNVYLSIENLGVLWTNNPAHESGWDPELGTGNFRYPMPLTTSLGMNLTF